MLDSNNYGFLQTVFSSKDLTFSRRYSSLHGVPLLTIKGRMYRRDDAKLCLLLNVAGARKLCRSADAISDEAKNPGLCLVMKTLKKRLPKVVERGLGNSGFDVSLEGQKSADHGEGFTFAVDFPVTLSRVMQRRIVAGIATTIDSMKEELIWLVENARTLQPKTEAVTAVADPSTALRNLASVEGATAGAYDVYVKDYRDRAA